MHTIGDMARAAGVKITTIRYYERSGLLQEPDRTWGGQRRYTETDLARLRFIRHARELGFDLVAIRELLVMSAQPKAACAQTDAVAARHLADVRDRIARLKRLEVALDSLVTLGNSPNDECAVLRTLADDDQCQTEH